MAFAAGDANNDGVINAADIVEIVNYINGSRSKKFAILMAMLQKYK